MSEEELKKAFGLFDQDNSGFITGAELMSVFEKVGLIFSNAEKTTLLRKLDANKDGKVSLQEFMAITKKKTQPQFRIFNELITDIIALQKSFLSSSDIDPSDDIEQCVLKLRGNVASFSQEQLEVLVRLHDNHYRSLSHYESQLFNLLPVRKVIAESGIKPLLSEAWGKPALGGFFAEQRSTKGLTAKEIIAQLGLDYTGSEFVDADSGKLDEVVFIVDATMSVRDGTLVPIDPRIRTRISEGIAKYDESLVGKVKKLLERSFDCAVDDGSEQAKACPTRVAPPYTGTGFCVHGEKLKVENNNNNNEKNKFELKFVEEHVATAPDGKKKYITFPIGTLFLAQGDVNETVKIAVWNGDNWIFKFKQPSDVPAWLASKIGKAAEAIISEFNSYIEIGIKNNPEKPPALKQNPDAIKLLKRGAEVALVAKESKQHFNIKDARHFRVHCWQEGTIVRLRKPPGEQHKKGDGKNQWVQMIDTGEISFGTRRTRTYTYFRVIAQPEGGVALKSMFHETYGKEWFLAVDLFGAPFAQKDSVSDHSIFFVHH